MSLLKKIIESDDLTTTFNAHNALKKKFPLRDFTKVEDENHLHNAHAYLVNKGFKPVSKESWGGSTTYHYARPHPHTTHQVSLTAGLASADERVNEIVVKKDGKSEKHTSRQSMTFLKKHFGD